MTVQLGILEDGTEFERNTNWNKYKIGGKRWSVAGAKQVGQAITTSQTDLKDSVELISCYPFLGEKYQTGIEIWIPSTEVVVVQ